MMMLMKVMSLPPKFVNLLQHLLRAHIQVLLWKAVDQKAAPIESEDITNFGWDIKNDIPAPLIAQGHPAPPVLIDVICYLCRSKACSCNKQLIANVLENLAVAIRTHMSVYLNMMLIRRTTIKCMY